MSRGTLLLFACLTLLSAQVCLAQNRVLLRDITAITLRRGDQTTGRRSSPVPQLQCIGGTAQGRHSPKVVQCYNRGFDGLDVAWECTADMPSDYQFGRIAVTCEGYNNPNDPYVLAGSCGLKYELDYSVGGVKGGSYLKRPTESQGSNTIFYVIIIGAVLYMLYLSMTATREGNEGDRFRGGGGGGYPGDDTDPRGPPPPYGWRPADAPPPYSGAKGSSQTGGTTSGGSTGSSYTGFLSGLGLGALGSYLYNNYAGSGQNSGAYRRRGPTQFERDTGFYSNDYDQPGPSHWAGGSSSSSGGGGGGSSSTHTSAGFGGTERR